MLLISTIHLFILNFIFESVSTSDEESTAVDKQNLNIQTPYVDNIFDENSYQDFMFYSYEKFNYGESFEKLIQQHSHEVLNKKDSSKEALHHESGSREYLVKDEQNSDPQGRSQERSISENDIEDDSDEIYRERDVAKKRLRMNQTNNEPGLDLTPEEIERFKIWKNGIIPYFIDAVSFSDNVARDTIRSHLQTVNRVTSLSFIELPSPPSDEDTRWVLFLNRRGLLGCGDHSVKDFTNKGVQKVVLGYNCMATRGEIAEAVMSIAGVPAQHNDPRRDEYITVRTENIMPDKKYLFDKLGDDDWLFHDLPYDFHSITHYDYNRYSINGHATLVSKKPGTEIYPGESYSPMDILKIKMLYNFITGNKKVKSQCEKLFKLSNKFKHHKSDNKLNSGPKPKKFKDGDSDNFIVYQHKIQEPAEDYDEEQDVTDTKEYVNYMSKSHIIEDLSNENSYNDRVRLTYKTSNSKTTLYYKPSTKSINNPGSSFGTGPVWMGTTEIHQTTTRSPSKSAGSSPKYNTKGLYSAGSSPKYNTKEIYSAGSSPKYNTKGLYSAGSSPKYNTKEIYSAGSSPKYNTIEIYSAGSSPKYNTKEIYSAGSSPKYNTKGLYSAGSSMKYNTKEIYSAGSSPKYNTKEIYSAGSSPKYNTKGLYSAGSSPKYNTKGIYSAGSSPKYNTKGIYSAGSSPKYNTKGIYSAGSSPKYNTKGIYSAGSSPKYNTKGIYSAGSSPKYNTIGIYSAGSNPKYNTKEIYSAGSSPKYPIYVIL